MAGELFALRFFYVTKTLFYTAFALVCFAFNSILCRLALGMNLIDAASFTAIRIVSGAVTLLLIFSIFGKRNAEAKQGNWLSAFFFFAYAICFSFAYNQLTTGMGALILFGCVQATMIIFALFKGERPNILEWLGLMIAVVGLVYLVSPGLSAPPFFSSLLMAFAGIAWGFYTLRGKQSKHPLADTAGNFIRAVPFVLIALLPFISDFHYSKRGILFAVLVGRNRFGHRLCGLVCRTQISHGNPRRDSAAFRSDLSGNRRNFAFIGNGHNAFDFCREF